MTTPEIESRPKNRFLVPIQEYESPASRIKGFQELFTYGLRAPEPMFVVGHQAFLCYEVFGGITPAVKEEINKAFDAIREANPGRGAYIGRAFYVPGIDNPNGPRTAAIRDKEQYIKEVTKFWEFVTENGYNIPGADIALILHPFIHVMDPPRKQYANIPLKEDERLPYGAGYLVPNPQPGRQNLIRILGISGTDEAVMSYPHDVYDVDPDTDTIHKKRIEIKDKTYVPGSGNEYGVFDIPHRFQNLQALTDKQLLAIAHEVKDVFKNGPKRIEFAIQEDGIYYREIAPWQPTNSRELLKLSSGESVSGPVIRVTSLADIARIKEKEVVVFFPPEAFRERTTDLFARVAILPRVKQMVALVHGTIETSHMTRILSDAGRSVVLVGDQEFDDGTPLRVFRGEDGLPKVEFLNPYIDAIVPFSDVHILSKGEAGQKVARLSEMSHSGLPIPDGFAIRSKAIWQYLTDIGLRSQIVALDSLDLGNPSELEKTAFSIQQTILEKTIPPLLETQIRHALANFGYSSYAIRSSGIEDGEKESRAGLYQSEMAVAPEDVPKMIKKTITSYFSPASILLSRNSDQRPSDMTIGIGIHEYIQETKDTVGAVIFTDRDSIRIEATPGSPEGIVSGTTKDYLKITISRASGEIRTEQFGNPDISLTQNQIKEVTDITKQVEETFGSYQDIESLITPDRGVVIVQARPL